VTAPLLAQALSSRAAVHVGARPAEGSVPAMRADCGVPEKDDWYQSVVGGGSVPHGLAPHDWVAGARSVEEYSDEPSRARSAAADPLRGDWSRDDCSAVPTEVDQCEPAAPRDDWVPDDCLVANDCSAPAHPDDSARAVHSPVALLVDSIQADYSAAGRSWRAARPDDSPVRCHERPGRAWELPASLGERASPALPWSCLREPFSAIVAARSVLRGAAQAPAAGPRRAVAVAAARPWR